MASPSRVAPQAPAAYCASPWDPAYPRSQCITTAHYRLYTDLPDAQVVDQLAQIMEGAHRHYAQITPPKPGVQAPMKCFVFSRRDEWAAFTTKNAGEDAPIYLKINRGAYTVDDWFVAFWLGDRGTFAVAAHEGWHQYVTRNFAARMPPALEEGIACMFENIQWEGRLPRWNLTDSPARSQVLKDAIEAGRLWTLAELLRLHAGDVIKMPKNRIETFYAQDWALARFLLRDTGRYRPAMDRYLAALASGGVYRPANLAHLRINAWHPTLSQPQLEHYLGVPLAKLENEYRAFCQQLADRYDD